MAESIINQPLDIIYATPTDLNNVLKTGICGYTTGASNAPFDYGVVFTYTTITGSWSCQLCAGVTNDKLVYRIRNINTWSGWKEINRELSITNHSQNTSILDIVNGSPVGKTTVHFVNNKNQLSDYPDALSSYGAYIIITVNKYSGSVAQITIQGCNSVTGKPAMVLANFISPSVYFGTNALS